MTADFTPTRVPRRGPSGRLVLAVVGIGVALIVALGIVGGRGGPVASEPTPSPGDSIAIATPTPTPTDTPRPNLPKPHPDSSCPDRELHPLTAPVARHPADLEPTGLEVIAEWSQRYASIVIDPTGAVWTSGSGELSRTDPATGARTSWRFTDDPAFDASIKAARGGGVWLFGGSVIRWFDGQRFADVIQAPSDIYDLSEGPDGSVWGSTGDGVVRWNGNTWDGVCHTGSGRGVERIETASDGTLWIVDSGGQSLSRYDDVNGMWTIPIPDGLEQNWVSAMTVAPDDSLWITTGGRVMRFDGEWEVEPGVGLDLTSVSTMAIGGDGSVWAAPMTAETGACASGACVAGRIGSDWQIFGPQHGLEAADGSTVSINGLATSGSTVYATTSTGLYRYDGTWKPVGPREPAGPESWGGRLIADPAGGFWLSTDRVWHWRDGSWTDSGVANVSDIAGLAGTVAAATGNAAMVLSDGVWKILQDTPAAYIAVGPSDRVWTVDGNQDPPTTISSFKRTGDRWIHTAIGSPPGVISITTITAGPDGTLWVRGDGGSGDAIWRYADRKWDRLPSITGSSDGTSSRMVVVPGGDLLAGVPGFQVGPPVARFHGSRWKTVGQDRPDTMQEPQNIGIDRAGTIWIATNGLASVRGNELRFLYQNHWFGGIAIGPDGVAYVVGPSGIYRLATVPGL